MRIMQTMTLVFCGLLVSFADEPKGTDPPKKTAAPLKLKPADKSTSYWMDQKMNYSQMILRGLATGELEKVVINAEQMRALSKVEGFLRSKEPGYQDQLQAFDFASKEIARHARAGNLEGAAMGFQQLTISCFSCHAMLREPETLIEQPVKRKSGVKKSE